MRFDPEKRRGLYIVMLSIHGLIRSRDMQLGCDADTGGQVKYVIELVKALVKREDVERVDLLTRQVVDPRVDDGYAQLFEEIANKGVLVRIPCGPRRYLRKEVLWPYLHEFEDNALMHIRRAGRNPDLIHGHYADAGLAGARLANLLGAPFVFTGHSLGRVKNQRLLAYGLTQSRMEKTYNITQRILAEETALKTAALVAASTRQEVEEQYSDYENFRPESAKVIPPGIDLDVHGPPDDSNSRPPIYRELKRFLRQPEKPMVLALARPDERKNLTGLIEAYARNDELRRRANLVLVVGNRDDITAMESGVRGVWEKILLLIDKHDLYGQVAYPKHHAQAEVADIYRAAARSGGVFVNPALTEPFGLTLVEAAASGLPVVATNDGGPRDIVENCQNGVLVDPLDVKALGEAIFSVVSDKNVWEYYSGNGRRGAGDHYSWQTHVASYLNAVNEKIIDRHLRAPTARRKNRLASMHRLLITDIDNTLLGDKTALGEIFRRLKNAPVRIGFGVATGRHPESAVKELEAWGVPPPDVVIASVGTEIYSGPNLIPDDGWARHIDSRWEPEKIDKIAASIPGLARQAEVNQRRFKVSYDVMNAEFPGVEYLRKILKRENIAAAVIHSHGKHLDFLPIRASKGKALKHLAVKWGILMENILVAGDSGNDREMLLAGSPAVVVGNFSAELASLKNRNRVYFARAKYAAGVIEGLEHFRFLERAGERASHAATRRDSMTKGFARHENN
ncbi:MAG: HAD-IIB family hydrolase [Pseudomonadota bacterium]